MSRFWTRYKSRKWDFLKGEKEEYAFKFNDFKNLVDKIREKNLELKELVELNPSVENIEALKISDKKLEEFEQALDFVSVSYSVYEKKIDEELSRVSAEIKVQSLKLFSSNDEPCWLFVVVYFLLIALSSIHRSLELTSMR